MNIIRFYGPSTSRSYGSDAGVDFQCANNEIIEPQTVVKVLQKQRVDIPKGFYGKLELRSSWAQKGLTIAGGVVDAGYTGDIYAILGNQTKNNVEIKESDRVIQLIVVEIPHILSGVESANWFIEKKYPNVTILTSFNGPVTQFENPRAEQGFGSSGN